MSKSGGVLQFFGGRMTSRGQCPRGCVLHPPAPFRKSCIRACLARFPTLTRDYFCRYNLSSVVSVAGSRSVYLLLLLCLFLRLLFYLCYLIRVHVANKGPFLPTRV